MNKQISLVLILFFSCLNIYAQSDRSTAPVKWERYKVSERNVSIELPKMPVLINTSDNCNELENATYAVYAEQTVYQFIIASKSKQKISPFCTEKNKFSRNTLENRIEQLKQNLEIVEKTDLGETTKLTINEREVTKLSGKMTTYWLFSDLQNNKWIELAVTHRDDIKSETERFIGSINFDKNSAGIEIEEGAPRTLGDEPKNDANKNEQMSQQNSQSDKTTPLSIVAKPRASYTEQARKNQTQGSVMLRVTFLANGSIGSITPVTSLPDGLTEQSIVAASKIVFLPQTTKGKPFTVVKQVQYSFTIY